MDTLTRQQIPPIDFKAELNEEQHAAATAPLGPALVLAGAGSGKTRTLTYRVAWLISQGVAPWNILLLTFTNKSAREMLGRVEELTGIDKKQFWGGTFHSIGQKILRMYGSRIGYEKNFSILDQGDAESLLGEVIRNTDSSFLKDKENPKAKALYDIISYARNTATPLIDVVKERFPYSDDLKNKILQFYTAYKNTKKQQQVADYDDLLELWKELLNFEDVAADCQKRFQHILVDEYQDTNTLQSSIIDKVGGHHRIMAVGDDAQCIYTWRGANFENIMNFPQRHPGTEIYKIETNYRSSPEILRFANSCLENQPANAGYHKKLIPTRESMQMPMVVPVMDATLQAHFVINRITGLLDQGYQLKDVAVLYRAHYQSMDLQMELSRQSVPYIITSGVRFFEQAHIRDLVAQLRFVNNSDDAVAFSRLACLLPRVGPSGAANLMKLALKEVEKNSCHVIDAFLSETVLKKVPADAKDDFKDLIFTMQNLREAMFGSIKPKGQTDLFADNNENTEDLEPLPADQVVKIAIDGWYGDYLRQIYPQNWQSRRDDLDSLVGFAARYDDMNQLLSELVLLNSETSDRSGEETKEDCIRMTTIHQAKGLEFPIVFIIGLSQGLFPLKRVIEEGSIEEERRLFYVAVTRAKDELYLSTPRVSAHGGPPTLLEPSQFISEIPSTHYEILRTSSNRM
jgi:DNA helicase II / ATP-dependent DNA helicase PcrA